MEENNKFDNKSLKKVTGRTADFDELSKDCVAFANSHGGYLAIGLVSHNIILTRGTGKGVRYEINPEFVANTKMQFPTTLKTIEPYRLKALIFEDLKYHPNSLLAEMATRLPDVDYSELEKMVRTMAKDGV